MRRDRVGALLAICIAAATLAACRGEDRARDVKAFRDVRIATLESEIAGARAQEAAWAPFFSKMAAERTFFTGPTFDWVNADEVGVYEPTLLRRISDRALLRDHPREAGPLQALVDLATQLRGLDVDLLVVVVPAKTTLYPELVASPPQAARRPDWELRQLWLALEREGIEVLDLYDAFHTKRERTITDDGGQPYVERIYRRQDIHWTSYATSIAADAIAERVRRYPWFPAVAHRLGRAVTYELTSWATEYGYFVHEERKTRPGGEYVTGPEKLALHQVFVEGERMSMAMQADASSPILVIGDSFASEYSRHQRRAGLPEHLLRALGFPVDLIALGHGSPYTARAAMAMTRPGLKGKKLVIHEMHAVAPSYADEWKLVDVREGGVTPDGGAGP